MLSGDSVSGPAAGLTAEELDEISRVVPDDNIRALTFTGWKRTEREFDTTRSENCDRRVEILDDDPRLEDAVYEGRIRHRWRGPVQRDCSRHLPE